MILFDPFINPSPLKIFCASKTAEEVVEEEEEEVVVVVMVVATWIARACR